MSCSIRGPSSCRTTRSAWPTGARRAATGKLTPGQLLADNVAEVHGDPQVGQSEGPHRRLVGHVRPEPQRGRTRTTWSTARWKGSWEGLPRDVIIANWNGGKAPESLKFFAGRGHPQLIAGYYDVDDLGELPDAGTAAAQGRQGCHRLHVHHLGVQVRICSRSTRRR